MTNVAAVKADSYDTQVVEQAVQELLAELGSMKQFIKPGDKVLLKPNLVEGVHPDKAVTTHPEVVRAMIRQVQAAGGTALVGDSPGVASTERAAAKAGIAEVCQQEGATLVPFEDSVEVNVPEGRTVKRLAVARPVLEADKIISLAKMKTHTFMGITGAVKNLFGCIVGTNKAQFHLRMQRRSDFAAMLIDIDSLVKPVLYIVDGITAMEGNGPRNGNPRPGGVILGGRNGYAVDLIMGRMMGFNSEALPVASRALTLGLTPPLHGIEVTGSGSSLQMKFKEPYNLESLDGRVPRWLVDFSQNQLTARPVIAPHCAGCRRCAEHCPPQAITMADNKAHIDYTRCIRCYCCQELCPHNAVELKNGFLLKVVKQFR